MFTFGLYNFQVYLFRLVDFCCIFLVIECICRYFDFINYYTLFYLYYIVRTIPFSIILYTLCFYRYLHANAVTCCFICNFIFFMFFLQASFYVPLGSFMFSFHWILARRYLHFLLSLNPPPYLFWDFNELAPIVHRAPVFRHTINKFLYLSRC